MLLARWTPKEERQRFYARNAVNTTLPRRDGVSCGPFSGGSARSPHMAKNSPSAHFPKFVIHCRKYIHELRKVMGTSKLLILVPLFDLKSLERTRGTRCRDFRSTALAARSFADDVCATVACLFAYMGALALLGIHGCNELWADESAAKPPWSLAERFDPAVAVGGMDLHEKSAAYAILRHPQGGQMADWRASRKNPQLRGAL